MNGPDDPEPDSTRAASAVGETILQRFRIERVLGRGGMGEVLLAHDTVLHRRVALKRLRPEGAEGEGRRSAVLREARRAGRINDPRIAAIHDVLDLGDDVLIVMEYVEGATLRARVNRPLTPGEFWELATPCVEAVAVAHGHGLIHRDIKPENLMVTRDGRIKILDFGIARHPDAADDATPIAATTMTAEGRAAVIAGTPQYMAPEAHYGGRIDERTDIFSLGTVFYELLTGRNPFTASSHAEVLERVMTAHPVPPSTLNPEVGPALSGVIARMMAKEPAQRQASCAEVLRELEAARRSELAARTPAAPSEDRAVEGVRRRTLPAAVVWATVVMVGLVAGVVAVWRTAVVPRLPKDTHLTVLAPVTEGAAEDFARFALGAVELLARRLQAHQDRPGFQLASFQEVLDEELATPADARKVQGVNLALVPTLRREAGSFHARLDLWDASRNRLIASRAVEAPVAQPFEYLDRVEGAALGLAGLASGERSSSGGRGVTGAGTLRFLLQGIGGLRSATTLERAQQAVAELELACRTEPGSGVPRAWLAAAQRRCFTLSGDRAWLDRAEASAREAVSRDSARAEGHRYLGLVLSVKGDAAGGLAALARACALDPTDDDTHSRLGRAYGQARQPDRERELYRSVIARRPHCWQPYWWLAAFQYRQGRIGESIGTFREMVRRAPDLDRGYANLGGVLVLHGDYPQAIDTLKRALALRPTKTAFDNLGTAYFHAGRIREAIDAYNQSFQFGFAEYDSWLNLGDAYYFLRNRQDQAAESYAQAIRLGRERMAERSQRGRSFDVTIPANLATVFPKLGEPDSARAYLRLALRADSTNMMVQYCAALTRWQLGEKESAVRWLDRAVRSGYPTAWLRDSPVFREWAGHEGFRALVARAGAGAANAASPN